MCFPLPEIRGTKDSCKGIGAIRVSPQEGPKEPVARFLRSGTGLLSQSLNQIDEGLVEESVEEILSIDGADLEDRWQELTGRLSAQFGREMTIEALLFLIGVQSQGKGFEPALERERKQEMIMEGTYCAFETLGFYDRAGMDEDGLWLWERRIPVPSLEVEEQEKLLHVAILNYFEDQQEYDD